MKKILSVFFIIAVAWSYHQWSLNQAPQSLDPEKESPSQMLISEMGYGKEIDFGSKKETNGGQLPEERGDQQERGRVQPKPEIDSKKTNPQQSSAKVAPIKKSPEVSPKKAKKASSTKVEIIKYKNQYNQTSTAKVDILWVVDDSGSMKPYQEELAEKFNIFIEDFIEKKVDFNMAITTTSFVTPRLDPQLNSQTLAEDKSRFVKSFKQSIQVGVNGSGDERGFEAVAYFLDSEATSFLREESLFVIVFVSDERDGSRINEQDLIKKIIEANGGDKQKLQIHSIVRKNTAKRYEKASKETGGLVQEITEDFHQTLLNIGGAVIKSTEKERIVVDRNSRVGQ